MPRSRVALAIVTLLIVVLTSWVGAVRSEDAQSKLSLAAPGTKFEFEVIESHDAVYPGDTPGHMGRDGGLTVRPNVALGDGVYKTLGDTSIRVGTVTRAAWDRVSGGLTVEFNPEQALRIAVGDEVWVDLNPSTRTESASQPAP